MSIVAPDPTIEFVGLFADQGEDVILARAIDWANEGLDPVEDSDQWVDTREGGHWRTNITPVIREVARLYDLAGTEVPMAAFVIWAWGTYLDDLAAQYDVERIGATAALGTETFAGPAGTAINLGTTVSTVPTDPDDPAITFRVTTAGVIPDAGGGVGSVDLPIVASNPGADGNVAATAITAPSTPLPDGVTVINALATGAGTDPETDESLRTRTLQAMAGKGPGNVADYVRIASAFPGVGSVKVVPTPTGPNSVLVMIGDAAGQPLPSGIVDGLQLELDPVPGKGAGAAPVGANVDVETSLARVINVAVGAITYAEGYSGDGAGGTVAVGDDIAAAIRAYMQSILPGDSVTLSHVAGLVATWEGVVDATGITLNGAAANVALTLAPPQVAQLGTLTGL